MPIKDFKKLFWVVDAETGEKHKLGHIEDTELTVSDNEEAEPYLSLNSTESFSTTLKVRQSLVYQLDVRIGHKFRVPNNWLKHHGYPMNRRK